MNDIKLETKTDRELLLLAVERINETRNDVKELKSAVKAICNDHDKLKRNFYILVSFLAGSGVLGGSIWALLR